MAAAACGDKEIVSLLISAGANLETLDRVRIIQYMHISGFHQTMLCYALLKMLKVTTVSE